MWHHKADTSKKISSDIFPESLCSATPFPPPIEISVDNKQGVWLEFNIQGMCRAVLRPLLLNLKSVNLIFFEWHWCRGRGCPHAARLVSLWDITWRNRTEYLVDYTVNPRNNPFEITVHMYNSLGMFDKTSLTIIAHYYS